MASRYVVGACVFATRERRRGPERRSCVELWSFNEAGDVLLSWIAAPAGAAQGFVRTIYDSKDYSDASVRRRVFPRSTVFAAEKALRGLDREG